MPSDLVSSIVKRDGNRIQNIARKQRRKLEFEAGRFVASNCLETLHLPTTVGRAPDRSPVWPEKSVGSISHSDHFAWAAVGRTSDYAAIGIDTEPVADRKTWEHLRNEILLAAEEDLGKVAGLDELQTFTLIFSAKESFYKCIYPLSPIFFGFHDVEVVEMDRQTITMKFKSTSPNPFNPNQSLRIEYVITNNDVFTACWLRPNQVSSHC